MKIIRLLFALVVAWSWLAPNDVVRAQQPTAQRSQDPQSETVYITKTGKKYHRAGCRYLRQSRIPVKLKDAKSNGYGPCSACNPPR
jgi:hypothetical protein